MILFEPDQQRAGIVECEPNSRMLFDALNERKIGALVATFEYFFEISDWLVRVQQKR